MFNIVAFDPGTTNIGMAVFTINSADMSVVSVKSSNINLTVHDNKTLTSITRLTRRLNALNDVVKKIIERYDPLVVSIESSFINTLRPAAYGPISQSIAMIEHATLSVLDNVKIFKIPPSSVKTSLGCIFKASKDEVFREVNRLPYMQEIDAYTLTEHEIDAIGINDYVYRQILTKGDFLILI